MLAFSLVDTSRNLGYSYSRIPVFTLSLRSTPDLVESPWGISQGLEGRSGAVQNPPLTPRFTALNLGLARLDSRCQYAFRADTVASRYNWKKRGYCYAMGTIFLSALCLLVSS